MPAFKSSLVALALASAGANTTDNVAQTGYSENVNYNAQVQRIKTAEEQSLHDDGAKGLSVDEAEKHWEAIAASVLTKERQGLGAAVDSGKVTKDKASKILLNSFHATHDAAVLVEGELKKHKIVPANHHMPSDNSYGYLAPIEPVAQNSSNSHSYQAPTAHTEGHIKSDKKWVWHSGAGAVVGNDSTPSPAATAPSDDAKYNAEVQRIKTAEEQFLHDRGAEGQTIDEAEKKWELIATSRLNQAHDSLDAAIKDGSIDKTRATHILLNEYHAAHDAAVLVEQDLKLHKIVPANHHMPIPEQSSNTHGYSAPNDLSRNGYDDSHVSDAEKYGYSGEIDTIDAAQDRYNGQVKRIKAAEEKFLHARGAEGHSVDDAERMWAIAARLTLQNERTSLAQGVKSGTVKEDKAREILEDQYHAVLEAAQLVEDELKAHHIVSKDHHMPTPNQSGHTTPVEATAATTPVIGMKSSGSIGPRWTWDSTVEAPRGTKDMGGWTASIYTPEQQARLGVTETGETTTKTVFNPPAKTGKVVFSKDPAVQAMVEKKAKIAYIKDPDVQQAQIKAKSLRGKAIDTSTTSTLIAAAPSAAQSAQAAAPTTQKVFGLGVGPFVGLCVGGVAFVALAVVGVAKVAKSKQTANTQRLTESRGTIAVVQGSTTGAGSQSPSRAVTQTNFVQML